MNPEPATVLERVTAAVRRAPDAVAIVDGAAQISYERLWAAAVRVGDGLREAGIRRGDVVTLIGRRSAGLAAAALGAWLAGAAYLPLDPDHPEQRIAYQLEDSGTRVVIADPGLPRHLAEGRVLLRVPAVTAVPSGAARVDPVPPDPGDIAYLIYTSGSTGRPKGTLIPHGALENVVTHFARELAGDPRDVMVWLSTFSFDISALELYLPLITGGSAVVAPDEARTDGRVLRGILRRYDRGIVQATPTTWSLVLGQVAPELRRWRVLSGGEPLPPALARRLAASGSELRNVYGPTETTIWSTSGIVAAHRERVDVGRPIANTTLFIVGEDGPELPAGELCIAGAGVAVGYHRRPDLTAERFGTHPVHGRYYRTGDSARWLPDGRLEVLGRIDRQIKLHGNRIELAEVENVLLEHPAVLAAAVVVTGEHLVAFIIGSEPGLAHRLWEHARRSLPRAAVPQSYVEVESFPRTGNDKVNYPELTRAAAQHRPTAVLNGSGDQHDKLTRQLMALWQDLLGTGNVDPTTSFFSSGGNSLLGARLLQRIEDDVGVSLTLTDLFEHSTPAQLAERMREQARVTSRPRS